VSIDETHDPSLQSWVDSANHPNADFPIQNLPFCMFQRGSGPPALGIGIGDSILQVFGHFSIREVMALDRPARAQLRLELSRALRSDHPQPPRERLHPIADCTLLLPVDVGDYSDFFASIFHATNVGRVFRPDYTPPANYKHLPIAYHGRASSIVLSGTPVHRPSGQWREGNAPPAYAPSRQVDYETEVGCFIGQGSELGRPVPIAEAEDHFFGLCLLNDWSARDIQRWETQPLGPFLSKSFATTISPWVITMEALEPFRVPRYSRPGGDPAPLAYLDGERDRESGGIAITLESWISTARGGGPFLAGRTKFAYQYWTFAQMLAHQTSNGCNLRAGDLLGSGTVSGPEAGAHGCLLERTAPLTLPSGESRTFLEDGDEVILRGYAEREGARRIGFGECRGKLLAAI
jgi:fumarylacetoacetase